MRSKGYNPATLAKRMGKSPVAGGSPSTNVTSGDVPAKNPLEDNDNGANKFKDGSKWTANSWAAAGKKGNRPAHSFSQGRPSFAGGKPSGGTPVRPLPALSNKPKKDMLNRGQAKKALSPRMNALSKRLGKGK